LHPLALTKQVPSITKVLMGPRWQPRDCEIDCEVRGRKHNLNVGTNEQQADLRSRKPRNKLRLWRRTVRCRDQHSRVRIERAGVLSPIEHVVDIELAENVKVERRSTPNRPKSGRRRLSQLERLNFNA